MAVGAIVDRKQANRPPFMRENNAAQTRLDERTPLIIGSTAVARNERGAIEIERRAGHRQRSGMTPEPTVQDETTNKSDDSAANGVQSDHADQQECEHHQGCAALPVAVSACDRKLGTGDQQRNGEQHSAWLGEPKPVTEPPPIASESRHARSLGQRNEGQHPDA